MKTVKLGLITAPGLSAKLTNKVVDSLSDFLENRVDEDVSWKPEIINDPLVGAAEYMKQLMNKAIKIKSDNNWDYVICLTDLPHFMERHIIMADIDIKRKIAVISIPSFGCFPVKRRLKRTISQVMWEMYNHTITHSHVEAQQDFPRQKEQDKSKPFWFVQRVTISRDAETENKQDDVDAEEIHAQDEEKTEKKAEDKETQQDTEPQIDIRYIIRSKLLGRLRILAGMVFANQPWIALSSFRKMLMFAFGTGIYIALFPTPWELSTVYSIPRFITLTATAMIAMVTWMIFAYDLWEKPTKQGDPRLRKLYNITTISTLGIIILIIYVTLFCLFLATLFLFVPSQLFVIKTTIRDAFTFKYYVGLTWMITSLGTLAGAIGTTSEDDETIREITYSYRQIYRYYEVQDAEEDEGEPDNSS